MSECKLTAEIIRLSRATNWAAAKLEWSLVEVYESDEPDTCLCGHFPIIEICVIRNKRNGNETIVGNVCVNKFLGLPSDNIFRSVKRIAKDNTKSLSLDAIDHAYAKKWITDWERDFSLDTRGKRKMSENQIAKRVEINRKVMLRMRKSQK